MSSVLFQNFQEANNYFNSPDNRTVARLGRGLEALAELHSQGGCSAQEFLSLKPKLLAKRISRAAKDAGRYHGQMDRVIRPLRGRIQKETERAEAKLVRGRPTLFAEQREGGSGFSSFAAANHYFKKPENQTIARIGRGLEALLELYRRGGCSAEQFLSLRPQKLAKSLSQTAKHQEIYHDETQQLLKGVRKQVNEATQKARAELLEASNREMTWWEYLDNQTRQWLIDSGRPEKSTKYFLSLSAVLKFFKSKEYDLAGLKQRADLAAASPDGWMAWVWSKSVSFDECAYLALKALTSPEDYPKIREQYATFLMHLRQAFQTEAYQDLEKRKTLDQATVHLLEDLCYIKFTGVKLFNFCDAFLEGDLAGPVDKESLDFGSLSKVLEEKNEELHHTNPELRKEAAILNLEKFQGTIGASFDPVGRSNVPKLRSEQSLPVGETPWEMGRLAHGTPTIEYNALTKIYRWVQRLYNAEIIPEYRAFLAAATRRKEPVFYVNLQQRTSVLEGDRSYQIEKLQEDPEFKGFFYSMALPMDGSAFTKLVKEDVATETFKQNVLGLFFDEEGQVLSDAASAKLPWDLLERMRTNRELAPQIRREFLEIIERVHRDYFDGEELRAKEDRQNFLMQFYSDLTDYLISRRYAELHTGKTLEPHERVRWVVQACKDNKDRGGAKNGIDEAKYVLLTYPLDDLPALQQALYDIYVNTLGAYIIKFEEILPNRLVYFTSLLKRYAEIAKDRKKVEKIRATQPDYFPIESHQSARISDPNPRSSVPTAETALREEDKIQALQAQGQFFAPMERQNFHDQSPKDQRRRWGEVFKFGRVQVNGKICKDMDELFSMVQNPAILLMSPEWETFEAIQKLVAAQLPNTLKIQSPQDFSPLQKIFDELKKTPFSDAIRNFLAGLDSKEEFLIHSFSDLEEDESSSDLSENLREDCRRICETPEGKRAFFEMIRFGIDQGIFKVSGLFRLRDDFISESPFISWPIQVQIDTKKEKVRFIQQLELLQQTGKPPLPLTGIFEIELSGNAQIGWQIS